MFLFCWLRWLLLALFIVGPIHSWCFIGAPCFLAEFFIVLLGSGVGDEKKSGRAYRLLLAMARTSSGGCFTFHYGILGLHSIVLLFDTWIIPKLIESEDLTVGICHCSFSRCPLHGGRGPAAAFFCFLLTSIINYCCCYFGRRRWPTMAVVFVVSGDGDGRR
jgi:hypothetical protein